MQKLMSITERAINQGEGVLRLFPAWVPRSFCIPGRRLKLHPDDYYSFGAHRGGIDERWFSSTTKADNGPLTFEDEGLSYVYLKDGSKEEKVLLKDAIELMGNTILGREVMDKFGGWNMYAKFFDNMEPLPHHLHQDDQKASEIGLKGKPEGYYFPKQLNNHEGWFPYTFFGLNPHTTKEQIKDCLRKWKSGDNGILYLSRAYKLKLDTGWDVPPGILHAPGSLLTYEPQRASDVYAMYQNIVWYQYTPWDALVKDVPDQYNNDLDYIVGLIDWELNVDPDFYKNRFLQPKPVKEIDNMLHEGYEEYWIQYKSDYFSATELTVLPGRAVTLKEKSPYGIICIQGYGKLGTHDIESPALIRFGQMTNDEFFITAEVAQNGIEIKNNSDTDDLVILKHFGPKD